MRKKKTLSFVQKKERYGYGFIAIWLVGTLLWFIIPLIESLRYSFMDVKPETSGMQGIWVGMDNYAYALMGDGVYRNALADVLWEMLWKTPLILIFSLFIAVILNQKFKGRWIVRSIFFLPVIIATGPVYNIIKGNIDTSGVSSARQFSTLFSVDLIGELFEFLGIYGMSDAVQRGIETISDNLSGIVWNAGIQILLFLAALQTIPSHAREAAEIEGATGWEYFWKIVLPLVSPMLLTCLIFTVIDSFTAPDNAVMERVLELQQLDWQFGRAAAMVWLYFGIVMAAVGIISAVMRHFIYYEMD